MPRRETSRTRRVGAVLMKELAGLVQRSLEDPRASRVTLTGIDVAPDLSHAKVFVTHLSGVALAPELLAYLNKSAGFLRHELSRRVDLRTVPQLRFYYDESIERGMAISQLIDRARAHDRDEDK